ncbi:MAG: SCE4755 family polysaccharide monooxygenase-like protein [Vicinamibacterales bacterium]
MKTNLRLAFVVAAALASATTTSAHFKMLTPAPWVNTNDLGDPQKVGPCGGDPKGVNDPILSKAITKVMGGSLLPIKIQETIFHSGHYRVALAVNSRTELPPDPYAAEKWTERGLYSVWGQIQSPPQAPILADGLFQHYPKPGEPASQRPKTTMAPWEAQIEIPNINCAKCTLQVIQFMADHVYNQPGGYAYHQCADLQVTADPAKPIDTRWPGQAATR